MYFWVGYVACSLTHSHFRNLNVKNLPLVVTTSVRTVLFLACKINSATPPCNRSQRIKYLSISIFNIRIMLVNHNNIKILYSISILEGIILRNSTITTLRLYFIQPVHSIFYRCEIQVINNYADWFRNGHLSNCNKM